MLCKQRLIHRTTSIMWHFPGLHAWTTIVYYYIYDFPTCLQHNRRAFCMRMRQYELLKCHRGIFCELFTFSTRICRLFSGAEWRVLGATFHKRVFQRIVVFLRRKWVYCSPAVALERAVFSFEKQYIEDKMAAECSYDVTFRAHFLSRRKRSVW